LKRTYFEYSKSLYSIIKTMPADSGVTVLYENCPHGRLERRFGSFRDPIHLPGCLGLLEKLMYELHPFFQSRENFYDPSFIMFWQHTDSHSCAFSIPIDRTETDCTVKIKRNFFLIAYWGNMYPYAGSSVRNGWRKTGKLAPAKVLRIDPHYAGYTSSFGFGKEAFSLGFGGFHLSIHSKE